MSKPKHKLLQAMVELEREEGKLAQSHLRRYKTTIRFNKVERQALVAAAKREGMPVARLVRLSAMAIATATGEVSGR